MAPGKKGAAVPDRLFELLLLLLDGSGDSLLSSCAGAGDAAGGNAKLDFSSDFSAFEGLKVNPPLVEGLPEELVAFEGSGLNVFPAKLNAAGAAGGAGPFAASGLGGTGALFGSSAFFVSLLDPNENPEKGLGAAGFSGAGAGVVAVAVGAGEAAALPKAKPAKGFGAAGAEEAAGAADPAEFVVEAAGEGVEEGAAKLNMGLELCALLVGAVGAFAGLLEASF